MTSSAHRGPANLIGDTAYDSSKLDKGVEMIAGGRRLRRWKIERLRVDMRFRRLVTRYVGFVKLTCIVILLRQI